MRVAFAADDESETTRAVQTWLADHVELIAVEGGPAWPGIGAAVGRAVADGTVDYGVVMCWTGTGVAMAANKVPGVRCALGWEPWIARVARLWNDANVLAMSLKRLAPEVAVEIVETFLGTPDPDAEALDEDERAAIEALRAMDGQPLRPDRMLGALRGQITMTEDFLADDAALERSFEGEG
ncbi:MAG: RpiB/LacA/LacB family sugar-phosphate isomerase [Chloroflexi bacterium]|nr:RpiB/LacA/LacB family sugar-phosphate isomerase [Chloroflexota bacterium]